MEIKEYKQDATAPDIAVCDVCPTGITEIGKRREKIYQRLSFIQLVLPSILDGSADEEDIKNVQSWFAAIPPELEEGGIFKQDFAQSVIDLMPDSQHGAWFCSACSKIPSLTIDERDLIMIAHWARWIRANINNGICT